MTLQSICLVVASCLVLCNVQGANLNQWINSIRADITDDSKTSNILLWAEKLTGQCSNWNDPNKKNDIDSKLKDGQEFFKLEESTTKEINPEDAARSRSLLTLCRQVAEAIAMRDYCDAGRVAYNQDGQEQNIKRIAEGGIAAAIDICAENLAQNYLPSTLLSFENPGTNPRMGFLGTIVGLMGERHTRHLQFFSTIKKLSALHAATTTLYHAYRTVSYLAPRAYILRKHIAGRAFGVKVGKQVRQNAKLH